MFRRPRAAIAIAALTCATAALTLPPAALAVFDYPVPSPYPIRWQLDFHHGLPTRIAVDVPGSATPKAYWYMTYTVTNNGDKEQRFYPEIDLVTTDGKVHHADRDIPQRVFDEIKGAERNPRLESFLTLNGPLRLGPAEARDGVAIWPETNLRMDHFQIYVGGLSGEAVILKKGDDGKLVKATPADLELNPTGLITLRKTLQLNFFIRGDGVYPGEDQVNAEGEHWVMR
jgi:hypothetical protein